MPDFFGPGSDGAVTTRPSLTPQTPRSGSPTWFAPCSSETSDDGTQFSAEWGNVVSANLAEVCTRAGIDPVTVVPGNDDTLVEAILALISDALPSLDGYVTTSQISGFITAGTLVNVQAFTASGTYTRSAGVTAAAAYVVSGGGGGGGGGCPAGSNNISGGGGGGGGGEVRLVRFAPSATHTITVGAGGAGVANANGGAGGSSSIGGGICTANGGSGGASSGNGSAGGAAGTGGAGGTSLGATRGCGNYYNQMQGAGGGNAYGPGAPEQTTSPAAGIPGETRGAGGSGANGNNNTGGALAGGNGADGIIIIWEYK